MKLYSKVACTQCERYRQCPQKTRMMVNYCGSRREDIVKEIETAISECRERRGMILRNATFSIRRADSLHPLAA